MTESPHSSESRFPAHNLHAPNLFDTRAGSVVHCACCGKLEITFRGHTLRLSLQEFDALARTVATADEEIDAASGVNTWRLSAETERGDVSVDLHADELRALDRLLKGAYAMMALRDSLSAIAQGAGRDVRIDAASDPGLGGR